MQTIILLRYLLGFVLTFFALKSFIEVVDSRPPVIFGALIGLILMLCLFWIPILKLNKRTKKKSDQRK